MNFERYSLVHRLEVFIVSGLEIFIIFPITIAQFGGGVFYCKFHVSK